MKATEKLSEAKLLQARLKSEEMDHKEMRRHLRHKLMFNLKPDERGPFREKLRAYLLPNESIKVSTKKWFRNFSLPDDFVKYFKTVIDRETGQITITDQAYFKKLEKILKLVRKNELKIGRHLAVASKNVEKVEKQVTRTEEIRT